MRAEVRAGAQAVPSAAAMGRRRRGGRRAGADRRFEVASVLEDLVRDVEALWFCRGGPDDVDFDRCDRLSFLREEFGLTFCWGDHVVSVLQPGGVYAP